MQFGRRNPGQQCSATSKTQQLQVSSVQFGLLSPDEVLKLSVAEINSEVPYDEHGNARFNGVNDPRMLGGKCTQPFLTSVNTASDKRDDETPGYFGHIELARRVYHANLLPYTLKVLRCICFNCSKLLIAADKSQLDYKYLVECKSAKTRFNYCYTQSNKMQGRVCDPKFGGCGYR